MNQLTDSWLCHRKPR